MNKIVTILMVLLLTSGLSGCNKKDNNMTGAYEINNSIAGTMPDDAKEAFNEAISADLNSDEALACIGQQIVNGKNYAYLVKEKDELMIMFVYKPIGKTAEITSRKSFNMTDYINGEINIVKDSEELMGGWNVPLEGGLNTMPQELATSLSKAFLDFKDLKLEALACLGSQVVAGTNYAILARGKTSDDTKTNLYMTVVYVDLNSNVKITSINPIDVTNYRDFK